LGLLVLGGTVAVVPSSIATDQIGGTVILVPSCTFVVSVVSTVIV